MPQRVEPYNDIRDLIEDSLDELSRRRAKYLGDNLAAIRLLADLEGGPESVSQASNPGRGQWCQVGADCQGPRYHANRDTHPIRRWHRTRPCLALPSMIRSAEGTGSLGAMPLSGRLDSEQARYYGR
jgi:hypothetical protein